MGSFRISIGYPCSRESLRSGIWTSCISRACDGEYHGRSTVSFLETTSDRAQVVDTRMLFMASDAKNSRTLDRKTACPSAPRQNGVGPLPFSCNSQPNLLSKIEAALPSP